MLVCDDVTKRFAETIALADVSFSLSSGSTTLLLGLNGAGKSTLLRILAGVLKPDSGKVETLSETNGVGNKPVARLADQDVSLCPDLSVSDNVFLGARSKAPLFSERARSSATANLLARIRAESIRPTSLVGKLGPVGRERVLWARMLLQRPEVALFDEPAVALSPAEAGQALGLLRAFSESGSIVVIASHRLDVALQHVDFVMVLRNGSVALFESREGLDARQLYRALHPGTVPPVAVAMPPKLGEPGGKVLHSVSLRGRSIDGGMVDIAARPGRITLIQGESPAAADWVWQRFLAGKPEKSDLKIDCLTEDADSAPGELARLGVGFVPADRLGEGVIPDLSVAENVAIANFPTNGLGVINWDETREYASQLMDSLKAQYRSPREIASALSGGNQQKLMLARCLARGSSIIVLYEPLQGLDSESAASMRSAMTVLRENRVTVVIITASQEEFVDLSDQSFVIDLRGCVFPQGGTTREET